MMAGPPAAYWKPGGFPIRVDEHALDRQRQRFVEQLSVPEIRIQVSEAIAGGRLSRSKPEWLRTPYPRRSGPRVWYVWPHDRSRAYVLAPRAAEIWVKTILLPGGGDSPFARLLHFFAATGPAGP